MLLGYISSSLKAQDQKWQCLQQEDQHLTSYFSVRASSHRHNHTMQETGQPTHAAEEQQKEHQKGTKRIFFYHSNTPVELLSKQRNPAVVSWGRSVLSRVFEPWWSSQCPAPNGAGASLRAAVKGSDNYGKPEGVRKAEFQL